MSCEKQIPDMGSNIRQNADNAQQTEKISFKVAQDAKESGQAVAETVTAMKEIAQLSSSTAQELSSQALSSPTPSRRLHGTAPPKNDNGET
jgi:methyl-accepting chemotaxis protein